MSGRGRDRQEHPIRGRGGGRILRGPTPDSDRLEVEQVRPTAAVDGVDGVVDRALDHGDAAHLPVRGRPEQDGLGLRDRIPVADDRGLLVRSVGPAAAADVSVIATTTETSMASRAFMGASLRRPDVACFAESRVCGRVRGTS